MPAQIQIGDKPASPAKGYAHYYVSLKRHDTKIVTRATVRYEQQPDGTVHYGASFTSMNDYFCRKSGRRVAADRANTVPTKLQLELEVDTQASTRMAIVEKIRDHLEAEFKKEYPRDQLPETRGLPKFWSQYKPTLHTPDEWVRMGMANA